MDEDPLLKCMCMWTFGIVRICSIRRENALRISFGSVHSAMTIPASRGVYYDGETFPFHSPQSIRSKIKFAHLPHNILKLSQSTHTIYQSPVPSSFLYKIIAMHPVTQLSIVSAGIGALQVSRSIAARSCAKKNNFQSLKTPAACGHASTGLRQARLSNKWQYDMKESDFMTSAL